MAITNAYLGPVRQRNMTTESNFSMGMKWTDSPLDEGFCKLLINYKLSDDGTSIKPRPGMIEDTELSNAAGHVSGNNAVIHNHAQSLCYEYQELDAVTVDTLVYGKVFTPGSTEFRVNYLPSKTVKLDSAVACINYNGNYLVATDLISYGVAKGWLTAGHEYYLTLQEAPDNVHGMTPTDAQPEGVYTVLNNNTYVCMHELWDENNIISHKTHLAQMYYILNATKTGINATVRPIEPNDITAIKAVNYGYNMLKENPYEFTISQSTSSVLLLDGIVPYVDNKVVTTARVGDEINFKLIYRYPASHASQKYYVQWELQALDGDDSTQVLQRVRDSQAYTPGNTIQITTRQTAYKQFTLIAKVYLKSVVDAYTYKSDIDDSVNLTPLNTITLAFYYLTSDKSSSTQNTVSANYDINTCTGMTSWMNRLVVWGVNKASTSLFVSEVNDPSYFAYPNNVEIFETDILGAVKWKDYLIVFTQRAVYQLSIAEDGLTITTKCIQNRLNLDSSDACTITTVQNLIFFKSGNYYYMIVPASQSSTSFGELTLAPISKPITGFLDEFETNATKVINYYTAVESIELVDYSIMLDQQYVKANYKLRDNNAHCYDMQLVYDTKIRSWTIWLYVNTTDKRIQIWIPSATADARYVQLVQAANFVVPKILKEDPLTTEDYWTNSTPFQFIDTGFRKLNDATQINKKWREIQFRVTNTGGATINFYNEFQTENDTRRKWYTYVEDFDDDGNLIYTGELQEPTKADGEDDIEAWVEDNHYNNFNFEYVSTAVCKVKINGKGRLPRYRMKCSATIPYELASLTFVFRLMTGR